MMSASSNSNPLPSNPTNPSQSNLNENSEEHRKRLKTLQGDSQAPSSDVQDASDESDEETRSEGNSDEDRASSSDKPKKKRQRTTLAQLGVLEELFKIDQMPNLKIRTEVATKLNMTPRRVQIWFQNKRAKMKRMKQHEKLENTSSSPPSKNSSNPSSIKEEPPRYLSRDILDLPFNLPPDPKQSKPIVPVQWTPFSANLKEQTGLSTMKSLIEEPYKQTAPAPALNSLNEPIPAIPVSLKPIAWMSNPSAQFAKFMVPEGFYAKQMFSGVVPHSFPMPQKSSMQYVSIPKISSTSPRFSPPPSNPTEKQ